MLASFAARDSPDLVLRLVIFEDEVANEDRLLPGVTVLRRPPYLPWRHLPCTQKILQWMKHALKQFPAVRWIGQMDSDTWIDPPRLVSYLRAVGAALPPAAAIWGGRFEHWQRLDLNGTIDCVGFSCARLSAHPNTKNGRHASLHPAAAAAAAALTGEPAPRDPQRWRLPQTIRLAT
eukprot:2780813-Prymnesium_polylepis.1